MLGRPGTSPTPAGTTSVPAGTEGEDHVGLDPGLRRLALGTLLAAYPGPVPPDWAVDLVAEGLAGHTLFGTNVARPGAGGGEHRRAARRPRRTC